MSAHQLPSPRTREQGLRDMMVNAIAMMDLDELTLVHSQIGPFCLDKLLDSTVSGAMPAAAAPEPEPAPPTKRKIGPAVPARPLYEKLKARFEELNLIWDADSVGGRINIAPYRLRKFVTGRSETIGTIAAGRIELFLLEGLKND